MTNPLRRIAIAGIFGVVVISAGGQPSLALFTSSDTASASASTGHWIDENLSIPSDTLVQDLTELPLVVSDDNEVAHISPAPAQEVSEPIPVAPQPEVVVSIPEPAPVQLPAPSVPEVVVPDPVVISDPAVDPVPEPSSEPAPDATPIPSAPAEGLDEPASIEPQPEVVEAALPSKAEEIPEETEPNLALVSDPDSGLVSDDAEPLIP